MLFNSAEFLLFFPVVGALTFAAPHRWRRWVLFAASCYFYMRFIPVYILILLGTIAVDYLAGLFIEDAQGWRRKAWLTASLVANIGVLAVFKYFNFVNQNLAALFGVTGLHWPIADLGMILPIGLSFHTFQAMSYTIEVYRGNQKAERNLGIYALYVMFYPQLVAGPIERPQNLLHQFHEEKTFDPYAAADGLLLMLWGFFKKVVVADRLAFIVDAVYDHAQELHGLPLLIATVLFAFQIYCDFSGYSDIAIGSAKTLGITLMDNFDRPYFSTSIVEFWRRWHKSLSTWFRDYLYIPLGGNRVPTWRRYLNQWIVFLVSGLWHGASWTYVVWGALHGTYLVAGLLTLPMRDRWWAASRLDRVPYLRDALGLIGTFVLVCVAWVFFRARTLADAAHVFTGALDVSGQSLRPSVLLGSPELTALGFPYASGVTRLHLLEAGVAIAALLALELAPRGARFDAWMQAVPRPARWALAWALVMIIVLFGFESDVQFIYFQF